MRRRVLVLAVPVVALCVWSLGIQGGHESARPQASAARVTHTEAVTASAANVSSSADVRSAAKAAKAKVPSPPKGKPEFSASFYGSRLNTKVWETCYPWASQSGCSNFGNKEYQWFVPGQVGVSKGILSLSARRVSTAGKTADGTPKTYDCRSGMITSYKSLRFTYGFLQVVAKVPHKTGLWPALWLAAPNEKLPPEIDLIEDWSGKKNETAAFFHPAGGGKQARGLIPVSLTENWQTYTLSWTKSKLTYYVGSKVVLTITKDVPHKAMYFVADLAEYMAPEKGDCSGEMQIRSVKVWK